jgi:hypothetical protein
MDQPDVSKRRAERVGRAAPAVQRLLSYRQRTFIITGYREDSAPGQPRWSAAIQEVLPDKRLAHWVDVAPAGDSADAALRRAVLAVIDVADRGADSSSGRQHARTAPPPVSLTTARR